MIRIDLKGSQIDQKEVTAYIQQQLQELMPHLGEKAALQVKLVQEKEGFEVQLTATRLDGEVQTSGWNENLFDAIKFAKEGLIQYFVEVEDQMNPQVREAKLQYLSQHGNLYLH